MSDDSVVVQSVSPVSGPVTGGTLLTVFGQNFVDTNEITISFGNNTAGVVAATFVSSVQLVALTPPLLPAQPVPVEVALNGQQYTDDAVQFSYFDVGSGVILLSVLPSSGPITGMTEANITGTNFVDTGEIVVRFRSGSDVALVPGVFLSSSRISCVTPSFDQFGSSANVMIDVSLNGQSFNSTALPFIYYGL